ncbi:MAG: AAA family ATPase [Sedimentisphaerales bacterium]|nr:AAA family ATPase [Sedimentisphaerales bacterium]
MRCIGVINQKGGCGKTTIAMNLAACLAVQGRRTLLVDMDPQSHCAVGLAVPEEQIEKNIYDVLITAQSDSPLTIKSIIWQISQNFDLAPSGIELAALEPQFAGKERREEALRDVLDTVKEHYNYCVIDCPPSVGLLTFNALRASDEVVIPVETGYFALHGLARQLETLTVLKQQCQQPITCRVLASMYDVRTKLAREVLNELRKHYNQYMFKTVVNFNTKLKEAASFGQPITEFDPSSKGMSDFIALAKEILETETGENAFESVESVDAQLKAIARTADELLAESQQLLGIKPQIPKEKHEKKSLSIQEKIDNFYGVRRNQGRIEFVALYPQAESVQLAGDFNNWQPDNTPLERHDNNGRWSVELPLAQGRYRYRYVVDGQWQGDPYNQNIEPNEFGEYNSLVEVE